MKQNIRFRKTPIYLFFQRKQFSLRKNGPFLNYFDSILDAFNEDYKDPGILYIITMTHFINRRKSFLQLNLKFKYYIIIICVHRKILLVFIFGLHRSSS